MPVSFALMTIMIITTSGLPPFAAFFSKGLILTSVGEVATTSGLIQLIILYASAAITFAYCVRMFSLVFMGKPSEHIQKEHVHEAPWVMLIPAGVLAGLCIAWGLAEPLITSFMAVAPEGASLIAAFTTSEFPIFMLLLLPTFLLAYWTYYKNFNTLRKVAAGKNPLTFLLGHAYFLDDFYYAIGRGINGFSAALTRFENYFFASVPDKAGADIAEAAQPGKAMGLKKGPSDSFTNYVAAAVVGFILIVILIILTLGTGA